MKTIRVLSALGILAMTGIILYAFIYGNFAVEGSKLLSMSWGVVSMVDLYVGFTLFSVWIVFREKSLPVAILWVFFMMTLGFFTGSLYMFVNTFTSNNDWRKFWLGKHA